jgi:hypothetical protein
MPRARVLVTLTEEAVVDVPADVDVEAYLRERLAIEWGDVFVSRILAERSISVEWTPVPEAAVDETEPDGAERAMEPAGDTGSTLGAVLDSVASFVGGIKDSLIGRGDSARIDGTPEDAVEVAADDADAVASAVPSQGLVQHEESLSASPAVASADAVGEGDGELLTREELLALFTDPLYSEMIRSAVRERAERVLDPLVGEVVEELEPLLRHHVERHSA